MSDKKLEKVIFNPDGADPVEFFVLEQTRIGGFDYILVTDFEEGDGEALILKDVSEDGEEERVFFIVPGSLWRRGGKQIRDSIRR